MYEVNLLRIFSRCFGIDLIVLTKQKGVDILSQQYTLTFAEINEVEVWAKAMLKQ